MILYLLRGLNCLIIGFIGLGKIYFVYVMYYFVKVYYVIDEEMELIVFNCVDYVNNFEFLMSYLFGYVKGVFIGVDEEKMGIID